MSGEIEISFTAAQIIVWAQLVTSVCLAIGGVAFSVICIRLLINNPKENRTMAGTMYKLDRTGHGEVAKWGDDAESRAAGGAAFKELADKGFAMFDVSDRLIGKPALRAFDPEATEIIAVPRLVAG